MTSIKPSEFYRETDQIVEVAGEKGDRAMALARFFQRLSQKVQEFRDVADAEGVPADARDQLIAYRRQLDEGPPEGDGVAVPKEEPAPARSRREREPCHGKTSEGLLCGKRRGHVAGCPEAGQRSAIQERRDEGRAADGARVELAGRIRALDGWRDMLPSDIAAKLGVPQTEVNMAYPLLTGEKAP